MFTDISKPKKMEKLKIHLTYEDIRKIFYNYINSGNHIEEFDNLLKTLNNEEREINEP